MCDGILPYRGDDTVAMLSSNPNILKLRSQFTESIRVGSITYVS